MIQTKKTCALRNSLIFTLLFCAANISAAHEVQHQVTQAQATAVRLFYADGKPFSNESYELYADNSEKPTQTGRTDARGRVVFLADQTTSWRLRAFSAGGHGVDLRFEVSADRASSALVPDPPRDRGTGMVLGLALILAIFGALQLYLRKKKST